MARFRRTVSAKKEYLCDLYGTCGEHSPTFMDKQMKNRRIRTAILSLLWLAASCAAQQKPDEATLYVSIPPLKEVVGGIVGDDFRTEVPNCLQEFVQYHLRGHNAPVERCGDGSVCKLLATET